MLTTLSENSQTKTKIHLSGITVKKSDLSKLCQKYGQNIHQIVLFNNGIIPSAFTTLPKAKWDHLIKLYIWKNNLGSQGCKYISASSLKSLQSLELGSNQIDNYGVSHLSKSQLPALKELDLSVNLIGVDGFKSLIRLHASNLNSIWLRNNKLSESQILLLVLEQRQIKHLSLYSNQLNGGANCTLKSFLSAKFIQLSLRI